MISSISDGGCSSSSSSGEVSSASNNKLRSGFTLSHSFCSMLFREVKFTYHNGSIRIEIKDMGDSVCLSIEDNGMGIDPDNIHKLFNVAEAFKNLLLIRISEVIEEFISI